jgi:hypothetical protein
MENGTGHLASGIWHLASGIGPQPQPQPESHASHLLPDAFI